MTDTKTKLRPEIVREALNAFMAEHNISIGFEVGENSDTHGIVEPRMEVVDNTTNMVLFTEDGWEF